MARISKLVESEHTLELEAHIQTIVDALGYARDLTLDMINANQAGEMLTA